MKENPPIREQISSEQKLFNKLVSCTTEDKVAEIIRELDSSGQIQWVAFGGTTDNMGIIQNQAKDPVGALIEKATNSIDAVIQKEVRKKGIQPRNMQDAMERLFGIKGGLLNSGDKEVKKKHTQHVVIMAEGKKERPTISVIDDGEGIHPNEMTQTILRLGKSNKVNVPYLQGVYGQGGSGVLPFCGSTEKHYHFMLIAARVHPELTSDRKGSEIGFTLVRLSPNENVPADRRLLYYEYFTDKEGKIITVPPQEIDFPNLKPQKQLAFGCLVKLFDYQLEREYSDFISVELKARFELKLVRPALPIWFHDARKEFSSMAPQAAYGTLASDPEKSRIIRQRFTIQSNLNEYGVSEIDVIVFKHKTETKSGLTPEENRRVDRDHVVMFSVNGQVHFGLSRSWFQRQVKLAAISKYVLVHVDLSRMDRLMKTVLLSADRQHAIKTEAYRHLVDLVATELKGNHTLQRLEKAYASLDFTGVDENQLLLKIVRNNQNLSRFFLRGNTIVPPPVTKVKVGEFVGREPPTFLHVEGNANPIVERHIPSNGRQLRLILLTDATDEYMSNGRGKVLASQHPELQMSIHNTERGRTPITISIRDGYTLPDEGIDVLFSLTRKELSPLSVTVTLKPYEPEIIGPKLITIMPGAARGSAPVPVSPSVFTTRQGHKVKWFNDDYMNHELEVEEMKSKKIVYMTEVIEPTAIHVWKITDDIEPGEYLFRSLNYPNVSGRLEILRKKREESPSAAIPKVIFVTRDGRDGTARWDREWNEKRVIEATKEGDNIKALKVNLDYSSFEEYRTINGPESEGKIRKYVQTYFAIQSVAVDRKLTEKHDEVTETDIDLDRLLEKTMAGIADVLIPLADVNVDALKIED